MKSDFVVAPLPCISHSARALFPPVQTSTFCFLHPRPYNIPMTSPFHKLESAIMAPNPRHMHVAKSRPAPQTHVSVLDRLPQPPLPTQTGTRCQQCPPDVYCTSADVGYPWAAVACQRCGGSANKYVPGSCTVAGVALPKVADAYRRDLNDAGRKVG